MPVSLIPPCLPVVEAVELADGGGQGGDRGLPGLVGLSPHSHGQLYLDAVNHGQLGVTPHNPASVVVTLFPWPDPVLGGDALDVAQQRVAAEIPEDAAREARLPSQTVADGLVTRAKPPLEQMSHGELMFGGRGHNPPPVPALGIVHAQRFEAGVAFDIS